MSANVTHSYDVQVNHSVVFKCTTHDELLSGTPKFWVEEQGGKLHWKIDTSDMWCDEGDDDQDCTDSWKITIDALEVA